MSTRTNAVVFVKTPTIPLKYTLGYQWAQLNKNILREEAEYYVNIKDNVTLYAAQLGEFKHKLESLNFRNLDVMNKTINSIRIVTLWSVWQNSLCLCSFYQKEYICKHIAGAHAR